MTGIGRCHLRILHYWRGLGISTFVSLQKGAGAAQAAAPPAGMRIVDWTRELTDFADTAGLVANLDLVIAGGYRGGSLSRRDGQTHMDFAGDAGGVGAG